MRSIATAMAALALVASAGHAQGNDKGGGPGNGHAAGASMQGGGNGPGNGNRSGEAARAPGQGGGPQDRGARGPGSGRAGETRVERGNSERNGGREHDSVRIASDNRGPGKGRGERQQDTFDRGRGNDGRLVVIDDRGHHRDVDGRDVVRVGNFAAIPGRGFVTGCPPGLAKKNPPCIPPGQVRSPFRSFDRPNFWGFRLADGRYRYDDGYLMRFAPDGRIGGYIPLLGGALAVGNAWPAYYQPVALPTYYESYYGLGRYDSYRYADNVVYRIDPETAAITSIAALLTGDEFAVGRPMPTGYDIYNVPYSYRTQYADTADAWYRYSDGYVYQVDPETRLIAAAIELLAS